jgi:hypothetical protein
MTIKAIVVNSEINFDQQLAGLLRNDPSSPPDPLASIGD